MPIETMARAIHPPLLREVKCTDFKLSFAPFSGVAKRTTSVHQSQMKMSELVDDKIFDMRIKARGEELRSMRKSATRDFQQPNIGLAAYLTARATRNLAIDGTSLQELHKANETVNDTRQLLSYGRANVVQDLCKSQEPVWRLKFARENSISMPIHFKAAMAGRMGTGNCGEHAMVATALHAGKLAERESLLYVSGANELDHAWAETRLATGDRIVMDAWAEGPAVMSEDSNFSHNELQREITKSYDQQCGKIMATRFNLALKYIKGNEKLTSSWREYKRVAEMKKLKISEKSCWSETPVLSRMFKKEVTIKQKRKKVLLPMAQQKIKITRERVSLARDIRAIGSARALGANIKQAIEIKNQILNKMDNLMKSE